MGAQNPVQVLTLPGWHGSDARHWQTRWEQCHGYRRVEQHDWAQPRRGDWLARLDETVIDSPGPVVLVAHSLACVLVAAWARFSRHTTRVQGAFLVAPPDMGQERLCHGLPGWSPVVRDPLPFEALLVASRNDPFCAWDAAQVLSQDWGCALVDAGCQGHLNSDSGLGEWAWGHACLSAQKAWFFDNKGGTPTWQQND